MVSKWMRGRSLDEMPAPGESLQLIIVLGYSREYRESSAAIMFVRTLYFLYCIRETRKLDLPVWKGSDIAMLAYGAEDESRGLLRWAGQQDRDVEKVAQELPETVREFEHRIWRNGNLCLDR
jgi:hypothetical protein